MGFGANLELVPISLEANSDAELTRLTYINNVLNGMKFNYSTPYDRGSKVVVWFFADIKEWKDPTDVPEGDHLLIEGFSQ